MIILVPTIVAWSPVPLAAALGTILLSAALLLCFARLVIGPSLPDCVLALDMTATVLVGLLILQGVAMDDMLSLRVATVLALVNFIGTVGFSLYLRKKEGA